MMGSLFRTHNYKHESLDMDLVKEVIALGNPAATKIALYALTLEGALHQIEGHNPPKGADPVEWMKHVARWAIVPEITPEPPQGEF